MNTELVIIAALLGVGLAMDAFSVSLADGLSDNRMKMLRMSHIAGTFAGFQFIMPMIGWVLVHYARNKLVWFASLVPWIALALLLYIGIKMLREGIAESKHSGDVKAEASTDDTADIFDREDFEGDETLDNGSLAMQGIATSIDALSVGFTIASYQLPSALISSAIIGIETFVICMAGLAIGKRMGTILTGKAGITGGLILIAIGIEIWFRGVLM